MLGLIHSLFHPSLNRDLLFRKQSSFQASQAPTGSFDNQATKGDGLMHSEIEIEQSMQRLREIEKEGGMEEKGTGHT